ncbi:cytochrome b/b6 domain-containing protein [Crenobacter sp. SG2303]|uniref:Cytochrome b/b6 domain-containing protein n=1 Tax=Crenobacter oryzisoli TaxID=3056844 RepID=A0ABT7XLA9_9NEIS|nr:cytochrome b/b6 domain-containing protein [Crenobacter sp. SG2303]MDN0074565.1 cytochrome b/b6 domain-containing protein [Crenobacter sp. SG2303]
MKNAKRYPLSVCLIHWIVAIVIVGNLVIGWMLDDNMDLMDLHKSIGVLVLALAGVRLINIFRKKKKLPPSVNPKGSLQYTAEKTVHGLLYLCMLSIPLLGWLKTNAAGHAVHFFSLYSLPVLIDKNRALSHLLGDLHSGAALILAAILGLHVLGALVHMVGKSENVLLRIMPFKTRSTLS